MCPWAFFYWVDMLTANTLRHTAIVSGAGSYVCVMVEAAGIEPASEKPLTELSPGAGHLLNFPGLAADARAA